MYILPISGFQGLDIYRSIVESTATALRTQIEDIAGFLSLLLFPISWRYQSGQSSLNYPFKHLLRPLVQARNADSKPPPINVRQGQKSNQNNLPRIHPGQVFEL